MTEKQGAKCVYGGKRRDAFCEPTILVDVTPSMDIAKDMEVFGPVFPVIEFSTEDEAVKIANNTQYGLMGGIMTGSMKTAMKVASRIQCGGVVINGSSRYRPSEIPFGGYKKSGIGREGISHTLEEMSQLKTIAFKHIFE